MKETREQSKPSAGFKLTRSEKWILVGEGFITAGIIILMYYSAYQIFQLLVTAFPRMFEDFWILGNLIHEIKDQSLLEVIPFVYIFLLILAVVAIIWRLLRRYRNYELSHIIDELHYIAQGHFEHRISPSSDSHLQGFVDSIHVLVDSTVAAM